MTQHIPPINVDRNPAVEAAAKMKDVTDRARAARPVDQGADLLRTVLDKSNDAALKMLGDPNFLR